MTLIAAPKKSNLYDAGSDRKSMSKTTIIFAITTVVLLAVVGFLVLPNLSLPSLSLFGSAAPSGKPSGYQAVFLSNGQVYFGRLDGFNTNEPTLREVYYLKVGTLADTNQKTTEVKVEPKAGTKEATASAAKSPTLTPTPTPAAAKTGLTLVKLGEEIHGPADEMKLNKDQILFVENLRDDSQVVAAIKRYQDSLKVKK